jgi:hypothetical protein
MSPGVGFNPARVMTAGFAPTLERDKSAVFLFWAFSMRVKFFPDR